MIFWQFFAWRFGGPWVSLGRLLGFLRLSWEASGSQKPTKNEGFLRFLEMSLFGSSKLLMALLGTSCGLLGPIRHQNGPQNTRDQKFDVFRSPPQKTSGESGGRQPPGGAAAPRPVDGPGRRARQRRARRSPFSKLQNLPFLFTKGVSPIYKLDRSSLFLGMGVREI